MAFRLVLVEASSAAAGDREASASFREVLLGAFLVASRVLPLREALEPLRAALEAFPVASVEDGRAEPSVVHQVEKELRVEDREAFPG